MPKSTKEAVSDTADAASLLAKAEIERFKLKLAKTITRWVTHMIAGLILMLMALLLFVFLGLSLAALLQAHMSTAAAFALVASIYAVAAVILFIFRMQLIGNPVLQNVLNEIFDEN